MLEERNANCEWYQVHVDDFQEIGKSRGGGSVVWIRGFGIGYPPLYGYVSMWDQVSRSEAEVRTYTEERDIDSHEKAHIKTAQEVSNVVGDLDWDVLASGFN